MRAFETSEPTATGHLRLDLRPPVRLDLWALLLALGIVGGTLASPLEVALVLASVAVSIAAGLLPSSLVPPGWRTMSILGPLFLMGGVGISFLHVLALDPLRELAAVRPGEGEL